MFDRLIDLLVQFLHLFRFWVVVPEASQALVLRLGRKHRVLTAGFHWILPFGAETYWEDNVVPATIRTEPQSLVTKDGVSIVISAVLTWQIVDIEQFLLSVEGADSVLLDAAYGEIGEYVRARDWAALRTARIGASLRAKVHARARKFGLSVDRVQVQNLAPCKPIRLLTKEGPNA